VDRELQAIQALTENIFKKHGGISGLVLSVPKTHTIFQMNFQNDSEKDLFKKLFTAYCRENQIDHFLLVSESWMVKSSGGVDLNIRPSESKDRIEIVFCALISVYGNDMVWAEIRKAANKRALGPWHASPGEAQSPYWDSCLFRPPVQ
jgi:hypothetical protein